MSECGSDRGRRFGNTKRRKLTARDFLDLDAVVDRGIEEDKEVEEDDFIDHRAYLEHDVVSVALRPARFLMEDMQGVDPSEIFRELKRRYQLMATEIRTRPDTGLEANLTKWIQACPNFTSTPVWRL
ncbi:hypothetical protein C8R44DRAFT_875201 [Mycena epipterygia]|nr:hypothetical protein C8R44DRAFT_875201 [Mycena epipterygia]